MASSVSRGCYLEVDNTFTLTPTIMVAAGIMCQIYSMKGLIKEAFFRGRKNVIKSKHKKIIIKKKKKKETPSPFFSV